MEKKFELTNEIAVVYERLHEDDGKKFGWQIRFDPVWHCPLPFVDFSTSALNHPLAVCRAAVVHRIRALVDIPEYGVKAGDLGGFIEEEENLSHRGSAWVSDDAVVYGRQACVTGNAIVRGKAIVSGTEGGTWIGENAEITDNATILRGTVAGNVKIYGNTFARGYCLYVSGDKSIGGDAIITAKTGKEADIWGNAIIGEHGTASHS